MPESNPKTPQQQNDPEVQRMLDEENEEVKEMGAGGSGRLWFWFVVIALIVGGGIAWGWMSHSRAPRAVQSPGVTSTKVPGANTVVGQPVQGIETASVSQLLASPHTYQGRKVIVPKAVVRERLSANRLLVSSESLNRMGDKQGVVVELPSGKTNPQLKPGVSVEVIGMVAAGTNGETVTPNNSATQSRGPGQVTLRASAVVPVGQTINGRVTQP
jgi:hypothetical protein